MFRAVFNKCLTLASPGFRNELQLRDARRDEKPFRWFTPEEAAVAGMLAKLIVPSDGRSPGIEDIFPPGQTATGLLDEMVAENPDKQKLYSHGLLAFDRWASNEHGRNFTSLAPREQADLFRAAQERYDRWASGGSLIAKMQRALEALLTARKGLYPAAMFYPVIRNDCFQIFYTSKSSWTWLQYDGPPMDDGYRNLTRPRLSGRLNE